MNNKKLSNAFILFFSGIIFFNLILTEDLILSQTLHSVNSSKWFWTQPYPTGNMLYSIYFADENTGFAAGDLGTILKTSDSGENWNLCPSNSKNDLKAIYFINVNTGFAAGNSGTILKTTDSGENWYVIPFYIKISFYDIVFCNKLTGYVSGNNGAVFKSTDAGNSWFRLNTGSGSAFFCLSFLNENTGVVGGYNTILKTTDGGIHWNQQNVSLTTPCAFKGISFTDNDNIYAAGDKPGGVFLKTTDGGNNWISTSLELPYLFGGSVDLVRSMKFKNSDTGFLVTDFATVLKTTDSGITWDNDSTFRPSYAKISVMYDINVKGNNINICGGGGSVFSSDFNGEEWRVSSGNKYTLRDCRFADHKTGIAVGEKGEFLKTTDGGLCWKTHKSLTQKFLNTLFTVNENLYYVAGDSGVIFKTSDGGDSWSEQTNYRKYDIHGIYFTDKDNGVAAGGYRDGERAFIYKTTNAGINWFEAYDSLGLGELNSLTFTNDFTGYCAGNNGNILRTYDGGYSWVCENIFPGDLYSVSFRDAVNGLISGKDGLILKTTNGGSSWQYIITGYYNNLYSIKFISADMAVAAGQKGTVLFSCNGGISWIKEMNFTRNDLYSVEFNKSNKLFAAGEYGTLINSDINDPKLFTTLVRGRENPEAYLFQNYPNPFNPSTEIRYRIEGNNDYVSIKIYSIEGKEIAGLVNHNQPEGLHSVRFDMNTNGIDFPSGVYFYCLSINGKISGTAKMAYIK